MLLFGLEGDVGNLRLNGSARSHAPFVSGNTSSRTEADFYLTARGRLGFVADHWLFYGTGGYFGPAVQPERSDRSSASIVERRQHRARGNQLQVHWLWRLARVAGAHNQIVRGWG